MAKKVYAIQSGFDFTRNEKIENKIVNTWAECLKYVKGVKGAKYKSFESIEDANAYLNEGNRMLKKSDDNYPKDCLHAYVDGSYSIADGRYAYGVVCVKNDIVQYIESGAAKDTSERNIRQIAGELKGALRAVEYALKKGEKKLVIFHDYEGIAHHATGAWSRKEASSEDYYNKMQELMNSGIEVIFVKVDSHTGDLFNELVDEKCKEQLGIPSDKTVEKYLGGDIIKVLNEEVREEIATIAPKNTMNIFIDGENIIVNKASDNEETDELEIFDELTNLYEINKKEAKKRISKMLSKQKEKYILYLLDRK
ncbi:ribonuclease H family protein [Clostridium sp. SM-530-WT-3G]|uniref:ribonuclease H1 domain-containing protein n=1 Tax=Clostridium sp. SM-530-WT-3G TaxID=2725303 RepID=UPI00145F3987|nr:ribonuclease H family protein [Clostridium sp. SM-530-WT-3G]NME82227.1 reverse transcriptase-like protein [Clostridium sp. SM-530-WT-3G]